MNRNRVVKRIVNDRYLYLLVLPAVIYFIVFAYVPMYGITLAFKEFDYSKGILGSPWIGVENIKMMIGETEFWTAVKNTVIIALGRLIIEFPVPIMMALLINELKYPRLKRVCQTVYTFPHFLSWVVISGIMMKFLSSSGIVNELLKVLGLPETSFLTNASTFRGVLYGTDLWKEMGWNTIIYLATIAGINPSLYEAAFIDGANRWERLRAITWPSLRNTVAILLILNIGYTMNSGGGGFDQIFNLYSAPVYDKADIIDTYIYRMTFQVGTTYGLMTAVGLFKSIINCILMFGSNWIVKSIGNEGVV